MLNHLKQIYRGRSTGISSSLRTLMSASLTLTLGVSATPSDRPVPPPKAVAKPGIAVNKLDQHKLLLKQIIDSVNGLKDPVVWENAVRVPIEVTTQNKEARQFTRQGYGLIQSMWDLEAHRSFVYALKKDENCIGAYSGLLMLSVQRHNPSSVFKKALTEAVNDLKIKRVNGEYVYTLQERLYAEVAIAMAEGVRDDLVESVNTLAKKYPMDFQALIIQQLILPMQSGGNSLDRKSVFVSRMMKKYPLVPMLWVYWLSIHQFQNNPEFIEKEVVPYSKKLVKWAPQMPVWYLYQGMYQHKAQLYDEADKSFDTAIDFYTKWGEDGNIPKDVNAPLWQALIYKSVNFYKAGKFDKAMKLAKELQQTKVNFRLRSEVRGIYLWEVQSLPTRLYLARNKPGDLVRARESLPAKQLLNSVEDLSAAPMYFSALNEYIAFKIAIKDGKVKAANDIKFQYLDKSRQNFDFTRVKPNNFIDNNYFHRGRYAVYVYQNYANAELDRINKDMKGYERFREYMHENLMKGSRLLILPRHVIEDL